MIAKGLDFPNVTLVGVINADVGLHRADFRAGERTFQLLAQVAGRTGRGPRGGLVLVQTFTPEHPSISLAATHNFLKFAEGELLQRREHNYPPYQRLARLIIRSKEMQAASDVAERLAGAFRVALERVAGAGGGRREETAGAPATHHPPPNRLRRSRTFACWGRRRRRCFGSRATIAITFSCNRRVRFILHEVLRRVLPVVKLPRGWS